MSKVQIVAYIADPIDGRTGINQLRNRPEFRALRQGQVGLCLNATRRIARLVDSQGGVYVMHAPDGYSYDLGTIQEMIELGWGIQLDGNRAIERDLKEPIDEKRLERAKRRRRKERVAAKRGKKNGG